MKYLSFNVVLLLAVIILGMPACAVETSPQNAVLVTGASSGIGRNIAERLARNGYFVYATARKDKDLEALNAIGFAWTLRTRIRSTPRSRRSKLAAGAYTDW
jgi:NADPH:quinone reductase-like Zn-dependent oxidoreductase